jgi:hypothetical protein
MAKTILVTGFPHCGTTILRAKIGECKNVFEHTTESHGIAISAKNIKYDFEVCKTPAIPTEFRNKTFSIKDSVEKYKDTIVIPIIRNPWYVFTSLHKRGLQTGEFSIQDSKQLHSFPWFNNAAHVISDAFQNNYDNVYPIRYEDMFINNFEKLKEIFDKIGLKYDDNIFESKTKNYIHNNYKYIDGYDKNGKQDGSYRAWQINQPFKNMNNEVDIPDELSDMLLKSKFIQKLGYSDPRITD